jgi:hypothetical protein
VIVVDEGNFFPLVLDCGRSSRINAIYRIHKNALSFPFFMAKTKQHKRKT